LFQQEYRGNAKAKAWITILLNIGTAGCCKIYQDTVKSLRDGIIDSNGTQDLQKHPLTTSEAKHL